MEDSSKSGLSLVQTLDSTSSPYQTEQFSVPSPTAVSAMDLQVGECLVDSVSVLVYCPRHKLIALSTIANKGHWFPMFPIKTGQSYHEAVDCLLRAILPTSEQPNQCLPFQFPRPLEHLRLQLPQMLNFVNRVLFFCELNLQSEVCCNTNQLVTWVQVEQILSMDTLWGEEPLFYARKLIAGDYLETKYNELTIKYVFECLSKDSKNNMYQDLLPACDIGEKEILLLYGEFVQHSFPSSEMNDFSFQNYLAKSQMGLSSVEPEVRQAFFRAFSLDNKSTIDIHDFVFGMAALDKRMLHGGPTGALRVLYIFRYYNTERNDELSYRDLQWFIRDLVSLRNSSTATTTVDEDSLQREIATVYQAFGIVPMSPVPLILFTSTIGGLKIRGTSLMFRAPVSPIGIIKTKPVYGDINQCLLRSAMARPRKQYTWAKHSVTIGRDGKIWNPNKMASKYKDMPRNSLAARQQSDRRFNRKDICNELIEAIQKVDFKANQVEEESEESDKSEQSERARREALWKSSAHKWRKMMSKIVQVCKEAKELFASEARVINVSSSVFILGDIHGNLADLLQYEKVLWPKCPSVLSANYLFLGDYVDRGDYSLECILYLLCCKLLAPNHFFLLRGNHELRAVQMGFTFHDECLTKFATSGERIWEHFNEVFDRMPIAAIVDDQVFCAHGGIPASVTLVQQLQRLIPCPLSEPENECPPVWEILWNDPNCSNTEPSVQQTNNNNNQSNKSLPTGFTSNLRRETAFCFGGKAVEAFLEANGFSHVIRAHEVAQGGFELHAGGRVTTVFSTSNYFQFNDAAVLFLDGHIIRACKVDMS